MTIVQETLMNLKRAKRRTKDIVEFTELENDIAYYREYLDPSFDDYMPKVRHENLRESLLLI